MKVRTLKRAIAAGLIGASFPAAAADLFVPRASGSCETIGAHLERASPGDTVWLPGGTYARCRLVVRARGKPGARIQLRALPGETPVLDGAGAAEPMPFEAEDKSAIPSVLDLREARYVTVEGLEVAHSAGFGISTWEAEHVTVRRCRIHHTYSRGLGGTGSDLVFEGNEIAEAVLQNENESVLHDQARQIQRYWAAAASTWYRVDGSPSRRVVWRGNDIHDSWGEGLIALHVEDARIERNTIANTYSVLLYLDHARRVTALGNRLANTTETFRRSDTGELAAGILFAAEAYRAGDSQPVEDLTIAGNRIENAAVGIGFWRDSANRDPANRYRRVRIHHNTIRGAHAAAIQIGALAEAPAIVENALFANDFYGTDGASLSVRIANPERWQQWGNRAHRTAPQTKQGVPQ